MDLVGKQIGNYVAKSELGRGGMGVVYLAEHPIIGRKVALKVLHEELAINEHMVQRLWLEAKSASEIDSEHIVAVLDFGRMPLGMHAGEKRETVYLAMELLDGQSLADYFWEHGISFREAVEFARQMCRALQASHEKGIVHRDLKPENIFLVDEHPVAGTPSRKNFVKILDFGIAKLIDNPYTRTRTGVLLGTPAYMSPEQCRGSGEVDHRSDIYSLGVMLYELTSGTVPFAAQGYGDVLLAQMTRRPEPPSSYNANIPKSLEAVILCALEKNVDDRFQSMTAFGAALGNIAAELEAMAGSAQQVASRDRAEQTTEKEAADSERATMMDPPSADAVIVRGDLHGSPTQGLAADSMHHRATQIKADGGMHAQTTFLKEPGAAPLTDDPFGRPTVMAPEGFAPKAALGQQRLPGVSLRDALGSTNAVRALEQALSDKGAPQPIVSRSSAAYLESERLEIARKPTLRIVAVAALVVLVGLGLLLLLRH